MATILCIDDDPRILELHRAVLETQGYTVLTALDGLTGIALARKHSVDAVLLDWVMPKMNGAEVAELLIREQPTLPIILCSGFSEGIPENIKWMAEGVIGKGVDVNVLIAMVEKLLKAKSTGKKRPVATTNREQNLLLRRSRAN
jgi:DNA-binding response OmpR family regulator